ncbi:DNA-formamidopyrimidine glycosylase family protein [Paradesertivirga mongoliensis]|uniref:DNA-formamidopyrimidine glycosylase family protein n=1 Tax=Paradesertivirga mongoliensis TaxID=2100740 RepID=A0ABW4ZNI4_9SPHI|nr:DNA-formamidopyrimidine glycosylase family protein [Pedobacter mongoliensis]
MPEAPTVLLLAEQTKQFIGQKVLSAEGKASKFDKSRLVGQPVTAVKTFGKELLICFPDFTLRVHLMLFGSYTINNHKNGILHLGLEFQKGELNFYACDTRLIEEPLEEAYDFRREVMNERFDKKLALSDLKKKPKLAIVDALIDQNLFAGIGNKIRNEVLFLVGVHPLSKVNAIDDDKLMEIIEACVTFMFRMFEWKKAGVQDENLVIYKREECPRDKMPVIAEKLGSRVIYYCDKCQELYE